MPSVTPPQNTNFRAGSASTPPGSGYEWEEAYLGLLWAVVWKLSPARHALLPSDSLASSMQGSATPSLAHVTPVVGDAGGGVLSSDGGSDHLGLSFRRGTERDNGVTPPGGGGREPVPRGYGARASPSVVAVAAVLRRLYHPRPSVRRLASRIAVRLAFDAPCFFSPLLLGGCLVRPPPSRGSPGCCCNGSGGGDGAGGSGDRYVDGICHDCGGGGDGGGGGRAIGGNGACGNASGDDDSGDNPDIFAVPTVVLRAYPRLMEWGGSGGGDVLLDTAAGAAVDVSSREGKRQDGGNSRAGFSRAGGPRLVALNGHRPGSSGGGGDRCAEDGHPQPGGTRCYCHRDGAFRGRVSGGGSGCRLNDSIDDGEGTGDVLPSTTCHRCLDISAVCRNPGDGSCSGKDNAAPDFIRLAPGEWRLLTRHRNRQGVSQAFARRSERGGAATAATEEEGPMSVVGYLVEALRGAGRRSEFAAAMSATRSWMLAGPE